MLHIPHQQGLEAGMRAEGQVRASPSRMRSALLTLRGLIGVRG